MGGWVGGWVGRWVDEEGGLWWVSGNLWWVKGEKVKGSGGMGLDGKG